MNDHDRNQRRYGKADDELVGFFSSAIGVKAQNLDSSGGAFNSNEAHWGRLQAMQRGSLAWFERVGATIAKLTSAERRIVSLVYTPHGAPTWLADALSTTWGGGSFVRLAITLPRATQAAAQRSEGTTVLDWLSSRGRRAKDALLISLREDAEALRIPALQAYELLRVQRVKAEQIAEREAKRLREQRNAAMLEEVLGMSRRRARKRFELRLKGRAA